MASERNTGRASVKHSACAQAGPARVRTSTGERAYVAVGANLGDRDATFGAVIELLTEATDLAVLGASAVYETAPVGPEGQGAYLNAVLAIETKLSPHALLRKLQAIEIGLGRDRGAGAVRWGPRVVDLDILFMGSRVIESPNLVVPHPRAHQRAFVMTPLAELAPDLVHPVFGQSFREIAAGVADPETVHRWRRPEGWPESGEIGAR